MNVYVKNLGSWRTTKRATALSHDLVVDSVEKENSTLITAGSTISPSDAGNWLLADGLVYFISQVKPQDDKTALTLLEPLDAFSRKVLFAEPVEGATIGSFIAGTMQDNWIACQDPVYALPHLTVSYSDTAPFISPEADSAGLFDLPSYCRLMRRLHGITVQFRDAGSYMACTIGAIPAASRQVTFGDGRSQLKSIDYASAGTAKITAIQDGATSDWYMSEDGDISQTVPARRAAGEWATIAVSSGADVATKVAETFAKNRAGNKIEFYSELDLAVLDNCRFLIHGNVLLSHISCKRKRSTDNRFHYKAGELATTATEKLKGATK